MATEADVYERAMAIYNCEGVEADRLLSSGEVWIYQKYFACFFGNSVFKDVAECAEGYPCKRELDLGELTMYAYYYMQEIFFQGPWYSHI